MYIGCNWIINYTLISVPTGRGSRQMERTQACSRANLQTPRQSENPAAALTATPPPVQSTLARRHAPAFLEVNPDMQTTGAAPRSRAWTGGGMQKRKRKRAGKAVRERIRRAREREQAVLGLVSGPGHAPVRTSTPSLNPAPTPTTHRQTTAALADLQLGHTRLGVADSQADTGGYDVGGFSGSTRGAKRDQVDKNRRKYCRQDSWRRAEDGVKGERGEQLLAPMIHLDRTRGKCYNLDRTRANCYIQD